MTAVHMGVPLGASARVAPPDSHAVRSADEVAESFGVVPEMGLSSDDVASRRAAWGPNRLAEAPSRSPWLLFLDQFRNLLVLILIAAAILAFVVSGELKDPVVIAVVVVFNAALGFVQERRAEASLAALKQMLVATARVRRDGDLHEIDADEIVAGDIVVVEAGDRIPADGRWLRTVELEVDEASFTGESAPVAKDAAPVATRDAVLAELRSMGFMNTTVTRGRGELVVTATGMDTQIGEVAGMLAAAEQTTSPLEHQIHMLARRLTVVAGAAVAAVMLIGLARGQSLEDEIINAVALAVAAIPEGLPAVLTITLALGTRQLAKRNAIMKRLASVETLGCTSVICTDKTGTLTLNQMTTRVVWVAGVEVQVFTAAAMADLQPLLTTAILCNDSRLDGDRLIGDPTEGALLGLGQACGLKQEGFSSVWTRTAEIPFDSTRKMMVTAHQRGDRVRISAKGAVDALLPHCTQQLKADGEGTDLDDAARRTIAVAQDRFAGRGLRVLGIASRETDVSRLEDVGIEALVADLVFEGLVGIMDPPRPEAKDAIALCRRAGIAVKMLTGDHATTATAIARELGLDGDIVTGSELDAMDDESLARRIDEIGVVARVAPAHKVRIVSALRDRGRVVAMTGDGVNDAPALKAADIGIAMGVTGTEVSKEAATMVLTDDNFATIVEAVRGGRSIYDNIVKFVRFQLSTNMGAILTILGASILALPARGGAFFSPLALLWVNLIMDGPPAMALGVDPPGPGTMNRPPRDQHAAIVSVRRFAIVLSSGAVMAIGTIGVYLYAAEGFQALAPHEQARATTMAFAAFVFFQMFNLFNARFERMSTFGRHALANGKLWSALVLVVVLQVVAVEWGPLQQLFSKQDVTATLSALDWILIVLVASSVLVVEEARKAVVRRADGAAHTRSDVAR